MVGMRPEKVDRVVRKREAMKSESTTDQPTTADPAPAKTRPPSQRSKKSRENCSAGSPPQPEQEATTLAGHTNIEMQNSGKDNVSSAEQITTDLPESQLNYDQADSEMAVANDDCYKLDQRYYSDFKTNPETGGESMDDYAQQILEVVGCGQSNGEGYENSCLTGLPCPVDIPNTGEDYGSSSMTELLGPVDIQKLVDDVLDEHQIKNRTGY
jgi:hypothetical protein